MKKIIFMFLMLTTYTFVSAQVDLQFLKGGLIPIKGGNEGKTYAIIIRTDLNKQALVDTTTLFLARYGIVDRDVINLDEINDATSEFVVPVVVRQTIGVVGGMMGIKMPVTPVKVFAELRFEFHDNGGVMIVVQNMRNSIFKFVKKEEQQLLSKYSEIEKDSDYAEYGGEQSAQLMTSTAMGKVLIALNTGLDGYSAFMAKADEYFADISTKYNVYNALVKKGFAEWLTDKMLIEYAENTNFLNKESILKDYRKAYDEGKMLGIGQKRWENQIRGCYDLLFKAIAAGISGTIEGVAEDGEQTWINMDGSVVPVDPKWKDKTPPTDAKEREKYLKKHKKNQY